MTVKLSTGWIQSNSMKFKAGLIARHWTYETLNEYINASVVILPIEKISCLIMLIQRADVVDAITFLVYVSRCKRREWPSNCRWILHNQIQNYLCRRTYDDFNSKRMSNAYVVILPNEIHREVHLLLWSSFPSFLPNFVTATYFKDRPADGKISAKCKANLLAKHWIH